MYFFLGGDGELVGMRVGGVSTNGKEIREKVELLCRRLIFLGFVVKGI